MDYLERESGHSAIYYWRISTKGNKWPQSYTNHICGMMSVDHVQNLPEFLYEQGRPMNSENNSEVKLPTTALEEAERNSGDFKLEMHCG